MYICGNQENHYYISIDLLEFLLVIFIQGIFLSHSIKRKGRILYLNPAFILSIVLLFCFSFLFIDPAEFEIIKVTQVITSQHIIMIMSMIALIIFSLFSFLLSRKNLHQSEDLIFNESNLRCNIAIVCYFCNSNNDLFKFFFRSHKYI